ncbi:hybrid sensor histidine kinase/response regulator [Cognatilysobacter tabacisoli]|uniref:hybrid sensor histidine kinase/response regulator n=1 Tax=Cognatilysobacter tabacisoli TaxID=2315424 RepID=UPI0018C8BDB8|nr:ATP-binding protein [Lysobacter tabacisoli]
MTAAPATDATRERVLLLLPTARDASMTAGILQRNGIASQTCANASEFAQELARGAGAVLVAEEALGAGATGGVLAQAMDAQPPWSDLPVLVLARQGADSHEVRDALQVLGNVTLLERPLRVSALLSLVRTALRARARQYQLERYLRDLEQARSAQATAARRKDEFLAMLAHELRNPLAPIRNALSVLELDDGDAERRRMLYAMMTRQADHMVRLVDDLMDASRMSRGRVDLRREPIDLQDALRSAIDVGEPLIRATQGAFDVTLPPDPLPVHGDTDRLIQVFGNLLHNAAKYGRPGGRVALDARVEGDQVVVTVSDDGIGIEPDLLPHVFDLFTQGQGDADRMKEGLGIGLSLVRDLVQMHDGTVVARSDGRGRGARFEVRLPLTPAAAASPTAGNGQSRPAGNASAPQPLRVLVVDDNVDSARSLAMVMDGLRFQHREANSGAAALEIAETFVPDVALLDIGMPGMDGYELARRMRRDPRLSGALLVAVSGWSQEQDRRHGRAAGFDHHFAKPVDIQALVALLDGVARGQSAVGAR